MADHVTNLSSSEDLENEIARLRDQIAVLQSKVQQLDQLAHLDPLIALPNRRGFMRQLETLISRVKRYGDDGAMLFVDIDGLKGINDSRGHQAGDEALIRVSEMLVSGVRAGDCVARLGGDEFGILLEHADEAIANETAARLVERIAACDFSHDGTPLPLSVAIGVGIIAADDDAEAVMARADEAMYLKKPAAA
ncbi:MAG TPA: GGDEF domain-containing protein [Sphingomicrobium sp.]|nr:GGDEF domain-containing protein [Sphingomicrobium sp.]